MPARINILSKEPHEFPIMRYILTSPFGETIYVYWRTIYEQTTEESLYEEYDIKNTMLDKKRISYKSKLSFYVNNEETKDPSGKEKSANALDLLDIEEILPDTKFKVPKVSPGKHPKFSKSMAQKMKTCGKFCWDEMDITDTSYRKISRRVQKELLFNDSNSSPNRKDRPVFVPIVVCIKTTNPYSEQSEDLLDSLIDTLYINNNNYVNDLHNMIFSFSELCSDIISLTNITMPSPMTDLIIQMPNKDITYNEGVLGSIPCEGDISDRKSVV